ncbi:MAG: ubiquinone biosynthesis protein COQ4 [Cryomorphaceae bacterium]|jgi:ubiquinone biosynthesis protein COQ4
MDLLLVIVYVCLLKLKLGLNGSFVWKNTMDQAINYKSDWWSALGAAKKLIADPKDTPQVFVIMQALNGKSNKSGYNRLLTTKNGGQLAYRQVELASQLSEPQNLANLSVGSVGHNYRNMMKATGYSANGLAAASNIEGERIYAEHPHAWYARRTRDIHDIWHVLTGYSPDEPLDEACLVAFSYAQTKGLGWALIALFKIIDCRKLAFGRMQIRAIVEAYKNGKKATWLPAENYLALLEEPLEQARVRLNIQQPTDYLKYRSQVPIKAELFADTSWA